MHQDKVRSSAEDRTKENGHGAHDAHRSGYLDQCREMDFDELARYIVGCLERVYDPGGDRPHSQEEFRIVWRLLREKHEAMPPDGTDPVKPIGHDCQVVVPCPAPGTRMPFVLVTFIDQVH